MKRAMRSFKRLEMLALAALVALTIGGCGKSVSEESTKPATAAVTRGPMRISVAEGGSLASAKPVRVVNEMEGKATILWLVKEGSVVEKGQVVCKLDSADVRDQINKEQTSVENEDASLRQAREKHAIQLSQNESDIREAELKMDFAKVDYEKYINGDYPQEKKKLEAELTIAEEELKRAADRVTWSRRLEDKKFITRTELEADELAAKKGQIEVELAKNALKVLEDFEYPKQSKKLEAERDEAAKELSRVKRRCDAEAAKTESDVHVKEKTLALATERLNRIKSQLEKSVIEAPTSGLVVYARQDRGRMMTSEPISEGKQLHEREEIMQIPDAKRMIVQVDVHESLVKKVKPGQNASIKLDAIPGRVFTGRVESVSSVPSTSNSWMNPDLKVYPAEVSINEEVEDMKPGMNAQVDILVAEIVDALQIPMQAVQQSGGKAYVYVDRGPKADLVPIDVGFNNDRMVIVSSGLKENERVFLAAPAGAPELPQADTAAFPTQQPPAEAAGMSPPADMSGNGAGPGPGPNGGGNPSNGPGAPGGGRRRGQGMGGGRGSGGAPGANRGGPPSGPPGTTDSSVPVTPGEPRKPKDP